VTFGLWYQGLMHAIPMITTILNLWMTDMAIERSHWWMSFITLFPVYMCFNWWGAMNVGSLVVPGRKGDIYGFEFWATNVPLTIFLFFLTGLLQGFIHWITAVIIDRIWPKRNSELYEMNKHLLEENQ